MNRVIKNRIGFSFMTPIIIAGGVISVAGAVSAIENPLLGVGLVLAGAFLWSSTYGSEVDFEKGRYRDYGSFYGIKRGEWKSLDKMRDVSILKGRSGTRLYSQSNRSTTVIEERYEVCLLSENHRRRFTVKKFRDKKEAKTFAEELVRMTNGSVVQYNPVVSEKTRGRR